MEPEVERQQHSQTKLKLYIYGSRQSDQFWLPIQRSHSRKPFCLTQIEQMSIEKGEGQNQIILNPLFSKSIFKIACGGLHSVILTTQGQVFTFGCNDEGALGRRGVESIPAKVQLQDPIDLISAGDNHSMFANSANGAIYFSGNYNYLRGQQMTTSIYQPIRIYASEINHSLRKKKIQKISSGNNHSCILINGSIFCRGQPEAFTTGRRVSARHKVENSLTFNGVNLFNIVDFQCGGYHTIAKIKKSGSFRYYVWGKNDQGQLGIGSYQDQNYPVQMQKLRNKDIIDMAAGTSFSLFLTATGELYGCGSNQYGNLGVGEDYVYIQSGLESSVQQGLQKQKQQNQQESVENVENVESPKKMIDQADNEGLNKQKQQKIQQPNEEDLRKIKDESTFIKSVIKIETPEPVDHIAAGSDCAFGWNKQNLYSWGFGIGYVLLNGQQEEEYRPFQVKSTILNEETVYNLAAGGQHVVYTAYASNSPKQVVTVKGDQKIWQNLSSHRKLPRRKT